MAGHIKITMDERLVEVLRKQRRLVIRIVDPGTPVTGAAAKRPAPREGTHGRRLLDWARELGQPFRTRAAAKALGLGTRHTSVLLVNAVRDDYGIVRVSHGVYAFEE